MRRGSRPTTVKAVADKPHFVPPLQYGKSGTKRFPLTPDQVPWSAAVSGYAPVEFTFDFVFGAVWADEPDPKKIKGFNGVVNGINRKTLHKSGHYDIDAANGRPKNPNGRTGMTGRGELGKWGYVWTSCVQVASPKPSAVAVAAVAVATPSTLLKSHGPRVPASLTFGGGELGQAQPCGRSHRLALETCARRHRHGARRQAPP